MPITVTQISRLRHELVTKDGRIVDVTCDSDIPLGQLHDALMEQKGWVVERMMKAQKEEEAASEMVKAKSEPEDPQP